MTVNGLLLAAQLVLGMTFIYLSAYSLKFRNLTIDVMGKKFSAQYELSSMLLLAGMILPINAMLRGAAVYELLQNGGSVTETYISLRFLAHFLMTIAGVLAFTAMWNFKNNIESFCVRFGCLSAMVGKGRRG